MPLLPAFSQKKVKNKLRLGQNLAARFFSVFARAVVSLMELEINQSFSFVTQKEKKEAPQKYWLQSDRSVLFPKGDNYFPFSFSFFLLGEKNLLTAWVCSPSPHVLFFPPSLVFHSPHMMFSFSSSSSSFLPLGQVHVDTRGGVGVGR